MVTQAANQNIDRRKCVIRPRFSVDVIHKIAGHWPQWRNLGLPPARVEEIGQDTIVRYSGIGSHVYSPAKTSRALHLPHQRRKRIVAFTSSLDEAAAAREQSRALPTDPLEYRFTFGNELLDAQSSWLMALFDWAAPRADVEVIVRIHPREGVNKRDKVISGHLQILRDALSIVPSNCRVVWPEEQISIYDLGESAHVVLTSWSTIGLEFARLGLPVLCCASGVSGFVVDSFHRWEELPENYFLTLEELLQAPPSFQDLILAYRFWNMFIFGYAIELDDVIPTPDFNGRISYVLPLRAQDIVYSILGKQTALSLNHARLEIAQTASSLQQEAEAVRKASIKIIRVSLGIRSGSEVPLVCVFEEQKQPSIKDFKVLNATGTKADIIWVVDDMVYWLSNGRLQSRFSPLIARLVLLTADKQISRKQTGS